MPGKIWHKIRVRKARGNSKKAKIRLRFLAIAGIVIGGSLPFALPMQSSAEKCPELKIVFARGSGGERWTDENYLTFRDAVDAKIKDYGISYDFLDLDYPAIGMNIDNIWSVLGAYFGGGDSYEFGASVDAGVTEMTKIVNRECVNTKYVLAGYSQGAMVVSKSLHNIDADKVIYAATFGDPKLYLPEGEGWIPAACRGENLSDYRAYVPDCRAYEGLLGSYRPYEPGVFAGKVGTWCNKYDIFCSSYFDLNSHLAYTSDNLYEDASKIISAKIADAFAVKDRYYNAHDTAILIDSTGSMASLFAKYHNEALNLARKTFAVGGRVALYDYRDLQESYNPVQHCDFETCTLETIEQELDNLRLMNGGDDPESLLSASFSVMKELKWRVGSTKSLVVLTDASYHSPDIDGVTFYDVKKLSQEIDPVNFYIITLGEKIDELSSLAKATDGMVVDSADDLSFLTETIMNRSDSLPHVIEEDGEVELPYLEIKNQIITNDGVKLTIETNGDSVMLIVNEVPSGVIDGNDIEIGGLDLSRENTISLIPLKNNRRGQAVNVSLDSGRNGGEIVIPNTPDTGAI